MRAVVIYESMFGNTHGVADAIAQGLREADGVEVTVHPVGEANADLLGQADLVVVGGPTHVHGMSRASTRKSAVEMVDKPDIDLELDPDAEGPGLRDWFDTLAEHDAHAAAFDTRVDAPAALTGRASKGIARKLHHHGFLIVDDPQSFLVDKENHIEPGENERARAWGAHLATVVTSRTSRAGS
jgi:hypothetical protein